MIYEQPSIYFQGIRIDEPVTTLTDLVVSTICFYAFYKLNQRQENGKVYYFLKYYFLTMGLATLIGGLIGHAFYYAFSKKWKLIGWFISMGSIALLERAAIEYARPLIRPRVGVFFSWMNAVEIATFFFIVIYTLNFFFVEVHSAYGLVVVVFSFMSYVFYHKRNAGSRLFLIAVVFSGFAALFYMIKWGFGPWFNHTDISHTFMAASVFCMYIGAQSILDHPIKYSS